MQKDLKQELAKYKRKFGLQGRISCSDAENKQYLEIINSGGQLPEFIGRYKLVNGSYLDEFFVMQEANLTPEEKQEYIQYKMLEMQSTSNAYLRTIKNCVVFFTVLTIIGLAIGFFAAFM